MLVLCIPTFALGSNTTEYGLAVHPVTTAFELELTPKFAARLMPHFDFNTPQVRRQLIDYILDPNGGLWFGVTDIADAEEHRRPNLMRRRQEALDFQTTLRNAISKALDNDIQQVERMTTSARNELTQGLRLESLVKVDEKKSHVFASQGLMGNLLQKMKNATGLSLRNSSLPASNLSTQSALILPHNGNTSELSQGFQSNGQSGILEPASADWARLVERWKSWSIEKQLLHVDFNSLSNVILARIAYFLIQTKVSEGPDSKNLKGNGNTLENAPFKIRDTAPDKIKALFSRLAFSRDGVGIIEFRTLLPSVDPNITVNDLLLLTELSGVKKYIMTTETDVASGKAGFNFPEWGSVHIHASTAERKPYEFFDILNAFLFSVRLADGDTRDIMHQTYGLDETDAKGVMRRLAFRRVEFRWQHLPMDQFFSWVLAVMSAEPQMVMQKLDWMTRKNMAILKNNVSLQLEVIQKLEQLIESKRNATALRYMIEYMPGSPSETVTFFEQSLASIAVRSQKKFRQMLIKEYKNGGFHVRYPKLLQRARLWNWDSSMLNAVTENLSAQDLDALISKLNFEHSQFHQIYPKLVLTANPQYRTQSVLVLTDTGARGHNLLKIFESTSDQALNAVLMHIKRVYPKVDRKRDLESQKQNKQLYQTLIQNLSRSSDPRVIAFVKNEKGWITRTMESIGSRCRSLLSSSQALSRQ